MHGLFQTKQTVSMDGAETVTPNTNVYVTSPIASITNTVEIRKEFYQQGQEACL